MNSDDERALFESYGWAYDAVRRVWVAPDGAELDIDVIYAAHNMMRPRAFEAQLRDHVMAHGRKIA